MGRKRKRPNAYSFEESSTYYSDKQPTINGAHAYGSKGDLQYDVQPYWKHRHSMFSRYDEGVWTTDNSWFEVTHENVANMIAKHVAQAKPDGRPIMLDCFAGIGGNAIAFALSGVYKRVYAIEKDLATLECAKRNAEIYGAHDKITWFHGDCFELLGVKDGPCSTQPVEILRQIIGPYGILFASPPWGGPEYKNFGEVFDLDNMPYSMAYMYEKFSMITKNMVLYLPRTSDLQQIADCVPDAEKAQIAHYCIHENSKALCAYLGDWKKIEL